MENIRNSRAKFRTRPTEQELKETRHIDPDVVVTVTAREEYRPKESKVAAITLLATFHAMVIVTALVCSNMNAKIERDYPDKYPQTEREP